MTNWNWRTKLKINNFFIKRTGKKIRNKKKDINWNIKNREDQAVFFKEGERKKKAFRRQTTQPLPTHATTRQTSMIVRGEQKNRLNRENQKKKITEKTESWKKPIRIFKKPTGSVRFQFYKPETEKTELIPN
jgi:hypothetical protein